MEILPSQEDTSRQEYGYIYTHGIVCMLGHSICIYAFTCLIFIEDNKLVLTVVVVLTKPNLHTLIITSK